jgi:hypothetical protein
MKSSLFNFITITPNTYMEESIHTGVYIYILHFKFLFSLFVFVGTAGHYYCIWTGHYFSIWIGQVPALLF